MSLLAVPLCYFLYEKVIELLWFLQQDTQNKVASPPKPPRAHDWKLLVKNIRVTLNQEENAAG